MRPRPTLVLAALAALLVLVPSASAACIKRHGVPIATGDSPNGQPWKVEGRIGNNGRSCRDWLLSMEFAITGVGIWSTSTGIPAGGHRSRHYNIDATDNLLEDGSDRVFSGTVGGEVAKVVATMSNNKRLTIRPKSPSAQLRRNFVWLRNVRYFVEYYPPEAFVTGISLFNASGLLLYRDRTFEGF